MRKNFGIFRNNGPADQRETILTAGYQVDPDYWVELDQAATITARKKWQLKLLSSLQAGDVVIVYDFACLGISLGHIVMMLNKFLESNVTILSVKDNLRLSRDGNRDLDILTVLAGVEETLVEEQNEKRKQTSEKRGKFAGRREGQLSASKLDPHKEEIRKYLKEGTSKTAIAKIFECSWPAIDNFIKTRGLEQKGT